MNAGAVAPALALLMAPVLVVVAANAYLLWTTRRYVYTDPHTLPELGTAVVLGCAPLLSDGRANFYFEARLDAAARLYAERRVQRIIVSGGALHRVAPGRAWRSECDAMYDGLTGRGVPSDRIVADLAGTRTRRSAEQARALGLDEVVFVSQAFHAPRAVFLGRSVGLKALAYTAASPTRTSHPHCKVLLREVFARTRALFEGSTTKKDVPGC